MFVCLCERDLNTCRPDKPEYIHQAKTQTRLQTSPTTERGGLIITSAGSLSSDISLYWFTLLHSASMWLHKQRSSPNRHPRRPQLNWLLPKGFSHRGSPLSQRIGWLAIRQCEYACLCVSMAVKRIDMSLCCASSALRPEIKSSQAQLTFKVQLQQWALQQSRVKYFYTAVLDDRETCWYWFVWAKRPRGILESWDKILV